MNRSHWLGLAAIALAALADSAVAGEALGLGLLVIAFGHCDGMDGPVVTLARKALDGEGVAEMVWLGADKEITPTQRYPVFAVDGCSKGCALQWLARRGIAAEHSYVVG